MHEIRKASQLNCTFNHVPSAVTLDVKPTNLRCYLHLDMRTCRRIVYPLLCLVLVLVVR